MIFKQFYLVVHLNLNFRKGKNSKIVWVLSSFLCCELEVDIKRKNSLAKSFCGYYISHFAHKSNNLHMIINMHYKHMYDWCPFYSIKRVHKIKQQFFRTIILSCSFNLNGKSCGRIAWLLHREMLPPLCKSPTHQSSAMWWVE